MSKLRWAKWFWADWSNDTALNLCSLPAQGLWMRLLCLAAQGEPYGCVTIKGRAPSLAELCKLCGGQPSPEEDPHRHYLRTFKRWLAELERRGVFEWVEIEPVGEPLLSHSRAKPKPLPSQTQATARAICSPRMLRDGAIAMARARAAKQRWKVADNSQDASILHKQKRANGPDADTNTSDGLQMQNTHFASIEAEAEAEGRRKGDTP
jgi:hypothetical protein